MPGPPEVLEMHEITFTTLVYMFRQGKVRVEPQTHIFDCLVFEVWYLMFSYFYVYLIKLYSQHHAFAN